MANLQDIRHRIKSVKNIQQITKAMKMVASARLRRAQAAAVANKPYAEKMYQVINEVASNTNGVSHPLLEKHDSGKTLFVILASDKGLAGAYSSNVFKEAKIHITGTNEAQNFAIEHKKAATESGDKATLALAMQQKPAEANTEKLLEKAILQTVAKDDLDIISIGRKTTEHFRTNGYNVIKNYVGFSERPKYENARAIATEITTLFTEGKYKDVYMIYTRFVSAISAIPETVKLLPFTNTDAGSANTQQVEYIYEPSAETVLGFLLPQYFVTMIYAALLQAAASELSSRMTAMSNATDNAQDLMSRLDLHYNKVRQANITREITEIVGGAEALK
ncbi:ATP synthase F1 subunit gamma [Pectinatus cerevisiiphilus]|uniref:ATP synthase gamma chain n=1 Tax=Pectinatus cerevisiiphilus TaxID=86956 RepID=A0A4R3KC42_9FIRM|nr:ATP synthase F1 subunit gamma [Pectinatus cerevisiiphilus]TCS80523.1 F-type H+-transporting ATPase subunit gamma [Pectinatus cerevisiiphilus]